MHRIWNALSRIVSRGAGGELESIPACWPWELTLPLPRIGELRADDRPCAEVQPSMHSP